MFDQSFFRTGDPLASEGNQLVAFRYEPVQNELKSEQAGRPIFDPVEMVRIITPGAQDEIDKPVTDLERGRFRTEYAVFKTEAKAPTSGTPLKEWPALSITQAAEMTALGILTVEQIITMPADIARVLGPCSGELATRAQAFLAKAGDNATAEWLAAENQRLRERNKELEENYRTLAAQVQRLIEERDQHG